MRNKNRNTQKLLKKNTMLIMNEIQLTGPLSYLHGFVFRNRRVSVDL